MSVPKPSMTAVFEHFGLRVFGESNTDGWTKAECPLPDHDDRNPSAGIHEEKCLWHCFACDELGDAVDLIQRREGCDFKTASETAGAIGGGDRESEERINSLVVRRTRRGRSGFIPPWKRV